MWYTTRYETTYLYPTSHRRRTRPDPGGIAFVRCLRVAPLPNLTGVGAERTRPRDRTPAWLRRPDRAQRDTRLQCGGACGVARRVFASPSAAHGLHGRRSRAPQRPVASQPTRFWPRAQHLDPGIGRPGQLRARDHLPRDLRRECTPSAQAAENQLEARQALDHQPRSAVPAKKRALNGKLALTAGVD